MAVTTPNLGYAVSTLLTGGLVAFPTETVYGLGADATNEEAVAKIFAAKGRPADHPLIVHLGCHHELDDWARDIPETARRLASRFWPGPLTLILKRQEHVPDLVTGGQDTVGLRIPDHEIALRLLKMFGRGIAAPSANRFGRLSPTRAAHVREELGRKIDVIVDGGPCAVGLESTILDLSGGQPRVLRPGAICPDALTEILGEKPLVGVKGGPRAPGRLAVHYAPGTALKLCSAAEIDSEIQAGVSSGLTYSVLSLRPRTFGENIAQWQTMPNVHTDYARDLYASLRQADEAKPAMILVERPPATAAWQAIYDRLTRAAAAAGQNGRSE